MQIYLPIAEMSVNGLLVLGIGGVVGFLSGMFGVGGGFLMTPLLIFIGVPPAVAVGTQAEPDRRRLACPACSPIGGASNVDFKMGCVLLVGGVVGLGARGLLFGMLQRARSDRPRHLAVLRRCSSAASAG